MKISLEKLKPFFENFNLNSIAKEIIKFFYQDEKLKIKSGAVIKYNPKLKKYVPVYSEKINLDKILKNYRDLKKIKQIHVNKNIIIMPLIYLQRPLAYIILESNNASDFNLNYYSQIIELFGMIYYHAILYNIAVKDPLTRLFTRRYFNYKAEELIEYSINKNKKFSIIMTDIDHFKHYNDKYGHQVGDEILRKVANKIRELVGDKGIVARYGGEEFIILLPGFNSNQAYTLAELIRKKVEEMKIESKEFFWRLSISLGVSTFPDDASTIDEIIACADAALYFSKTTGRNKVSIYWRDVKES